MRTNMGSADRFLRMALAVTTVILYFKGVMDGPWGLLALAVAMVFIFTSLVGFCPIYSLLGISTRLQKKDHK